MAGKEQEGRVRSYLREFSEGTTLHGVRYVGENNRHWTERSCWIVAMVFCTIFCGLEVAKVWHRWHDSPVIISFASRPARVRDIPFPALTICPGLQIPRENFDISSVTERTYDQDKKELPNVLIRENLTDEEKLLAEAATISCTAVDSYNHSFSINQSHFDTLSELSPNLNYFIHDCKWNGTYNCTNYFRPIIFTERGVCHTFNMMQDSDIYFNHSIDMSKDDNETHTYLHNVSTKNGGSHWGMKLIFKVPLDQYQDNCCLQYNDVCQSHFEVYLHAPLELAWYNPIKVTPWSDTEVRLRPLVASTDPALQAHSPYTRGCRFPQDQKLKYFKTYTRNHCWVECYNHRAEQSCSCSVPNVPLDTDSSPLKYCQTVRKRDCTPRDPPEKTPEMCDFCLPSCDGVEYETVIDRGTLEEHVVNDKLPTGPAGRRLYFRRRYRRNETRYDYARISIYFDQQEYMGIRRNEVFGFTDVLSNCGGLLGLFTGFSVITIIELLYFFTLRLCCKLRRDKSVTSPDIDNEKSLSDQQDTNDGRPATVDSTF